MSEREHIAVAMSGGVDSAVAAYLALQQGYQVTGINLHLDDEPADESLLKCAEALQIPLLQADCRQAFHDRVIAPAAAEYAVGRTPNPCCDCNRVLKFHELLRVAQEHGINRVFTGHYVQLMQDETGVFRLLKGSDQSKDQSYFLYRLTQNELSRVGFPLGQLTKVEVRRIAAAAGLPCASRPDSQDACFQIPGECCGETLRRRCGLPVKRGKFIHNGKIVGKHDGIHRYTIGQRQGLNVALGVPAYIAAIDAASGNIYLTTENRELLAGSFTVKQVNWCSGEMPSDGEISVRIRYRSPGCDCRFAELDNGDLLVTPGVPLRAVTPGQAAVFYAGNVLLGGGVIDRVGGDENAF